MSIEPSPSMEREVACTYFLRASCSSFATPIISECIMLRPLHLRTPTSSYAFRNNLAVSCASLATPWPEATVRTRVPSLVFVLTDLVLPDDRSFWFESIPELIADSKTQSYLAPCAVQETRFGRNQLTEDLFDVRSCPISMYRRSP